MLYPQKNLIPPFNDSGWFQDLTAAGGTMVIDPTNPHKMTFTLTTSAQGRLIWIPVEIGKTYTISFKNCTGLFRLYRRKVNNHDNAMALVQDSVPKPYTFTVDASYQGFITLRMTQGLAGSFVFEDFQLEEGALSTNFKRYTLGNKKPARRYGRKNLLDMYDSRWTLRSGTTFVNRSGSRMVWDSSGDYGGVQIMFNDVDFIGKTITFGGKRHADTGVLFFYRKPDGTASYVGLAPHEQYRTITIPYGSSECRFYVQNNAGARGNAFWSEDLFIYYGTENVYVPYQEGAKTPSFAYKKIADITTEIGNFIIDSGVKAPNVTAIRSQYFTAVNPNTFVRVIADRKALTGGSTRIFEYDSQYQFIRSNLASAVTTHPNTRYIMFHSIMASEGINPAMKFAYANDKPSIQPANMYPKKNFIEKLSLVNGSWQNNPLNIATGSNLYKAYPKPIWLQAGKYTVSAKMDVNAAALINGVSGSTVLLSTVDNTPRTLIVPYDTNVYFHFRKKDNTVWDITLDTYELGIQIERGEKNTSFEEYKLSSKPALLYPQKNLLPPFSQWQYTNAAGKVTYNNDYKMTMAADVAGLYYNHHVPVEKGKTYTCSIGSITANARVAIREVKANSSKVFLTNLTSDAKTFTVTPAIDTVKLEFDCTVQAVGTLVFENPMIEEGAKLTSFAPYKLGNKPL
jgi:hypothetical protein